jgi:hypothetical protein
MASLATISQHRLPWWYSPDFINGAWQPHARDIMTHTNENEYVPSSRLIMADPFGSLHCVTIVTDCWCDTEVHPPNGRYSTRSSGHGIIKCEVSLSISLTSLVSYDDSSQPKVEDMITVGVDCGHPCILRVMHQYSINDDIPEHEIMSGMNQPDWIEIWPIIDPSTRQQDSKRTSLDNGTQSSLPHDVVDPDGMIMMEPVSSPARVVQLPGGRVIWLPPSPSDNDNTSDDDNNSKDDGDGDDVATIPIELAYFSIGSRSGGRSRLPIGRHGDVIWSVRTLADASVDALLVLTGTTLSQPRSLWLVHVLTSGELVRPKLICRGMINHILPLRDGACVINMDGQLQLWSLTVKSSSLLSKSVSRTDDGIGMIHQCASPLGVRVQWFELTSPGRIIIVTTEHVYIYHSSMNMITYSDAMTGVRTVTPCHSIVHHDCVIVEMERNGAAVVELWQLPLHYNHTTDDISTNAKGAITQTRVEQQEEGKSGHVNVNVGVNRQLLWWSADQGSGNIDQIVSLPNGLVVMIRVSNTDHRANLCVINLLTSSSSSLQSASEDHTAASTNQQPIYNDSISCYVGRCIGGDTGPMMLLSLPPLRNAIASFGRQLYESYSLIMPSPLLAIIAEYACA